MDHLKTLQKRLLMRRALFLELIHMPQEKAGSQIELNDGLTTLFSFNVF
jgi:hypothetical protein